MKPIEKRVERLEAQAGVHAPEDITEIRVIGIDPGSHKATCGFAYVLAGSGQRSCSQRQLSQTEIDDGAIVSPTRTP